MKSQVKKKWAAVLIVLLIILGCLQLISTKLLNPPVSQNISAPPDVAKILKKSCYACHSNETQLAWYDNIIPAQWMVASHVKEGRKVLNFSEWDKLTPSAQKAALYYSLNKILSGEMPLKSYTYIHQSARVSDNDIETIKQYLKDISPCKQSDSTAITNVEKQYKKFIYQSDIKEKQTLSVMPAPNGIQFIPGYQNWKAISTSDRFDNGSIRVIYGNDIAIKAINENHINPWPDGSTLAKVAWAQLIDSTGNIRTGEFKQVEFMIKDTKKYSQTNGWGWARWRGTDLKPYGKAPSFTNECINCHRPESNNDYVFTFPVKLNAQ